MRTESKKKKKKTPCSRAGVLFLQGKEKKMPVLMAAIARGHPILFLGLVAAQVKGIYSSI